MTNTFSLKHLVQDSVKICKNTVAVVPYDNQEIKIDVTRLLSKFNFKFSVKNFTIGFIYMSQYYVTPYTVPSVTALKENGFSEANFFVPFSSSDYPKHEEKRWKFLKKQAQRINSEGCFSVKCKNFCDDNHIGVLSSKTLQRCLMIPTTGIRVAKHNYCYDILPVITEFQFNSFVKMKLGTYYINNHVIVFVYRDGHTYVTMCRKTIIRELESAGYRKNFLYVPLSNGEVILHDGLRSTWNAIRRMH